MRNSSHYNKVLIHKLCKADASRAWHTPLAPTKSADLNSFFSIRVNFLDLTGRQMVVGVILDFPAIKEEVFDIIETLAAMILKICEKHSGKRLKFLRASK
jgi:hypothetical protein